MKTECPHCGHIQEPNSEIGDEDVCDECDEIYMQFSNIVKGQQ